MSSTATWVGSTVIYGQYADCSDSSYYLWVEEYNNSTYRYYLYIGAFLHMHNHEYTMYSRLANPFEATGIKYNILRPQNFSQWGIIKETSYML